jgi:hypothetical protein
VFHRCCSKVCVLASQVGLVIMCKAFQHAHVSFASPAEFLAVCFFPFLKLFKFTQKCTLHECRQVLLHLSRDERLEIGGFVSPTPPPLV